MVFRWRFPAEPPPGREDGPASRPIKADTMVSKRQKLGLFFDTTEVTDGPPDRRAWAGQVRESKKNITIYLLREFLCAIVARLDVVFIYTSLSVNVRTLSTLKFNTTYPYC